MEVNYSSNGNQRSRELEPTPTASPSSTYQLTRDPFFYGTVGFFALLTTLLPGSLGQPNFMPIVQALGLTIFTAIPLRKGDVGTALRVLLLWLIVQLTVIFFMAWGLPVQTARAIPDGVTYRMDLVTWAYTGEALPRSLLVAPLARLIEILGVLVGSLLTGGLVGSWFLVRAVDLFGFSAGTMIREMASPIGLLLGFTPWRLLSLSGYAGFFLLLAQPILSNRWDLNHYRKNQRRLIIWSSGLLVAGLLLEVLLPGFWQGLVIGE
ncbi:MAG: hypothetical protein KF893_16000 [Caldilineaceae bacterium]|nr:hypothetical protein [Caldilineaceae bacterium]